MFQDDIVFEVFDEDLLSSDDCISIYDATGASCNNIAYKVWYGLVLYCMA